MRHIASNAGAEGAIVVAKVKAMKGDEGFNAATEKYEDLVEGRRHRPGQGGPQRPADVASIASLLLTTEALNPEIREDQPAAGGAEGGPGGGGMGGMY
jgi:chaperonin GroEL